MGAGIVDHYSKDELKAIDDEHALHEQEHATPTHGVDLDGKSSGEFSKAGHDVENGNVNNGYHTAPLDDSDTRL